MQRKLTISLSIVYKDIAHFRKYIERSGLDVRMEILEHQQLLALQGDASKNIVQKLAPSLNISKMPFMYGEIASVAGIK